ncbi:MAG TPA: DegV family protein [Chloroflexia bacterium]|nr:DegV family protein [Chloroflexia bacterium]
MGRIAFVTDSTAGLPPDQVEQYRVTVVPLQVIFGTETFRDGIDLTQREFFERLKSARTLPTTSQPTVADFEEPYQKLVADPEVDSIISVHISSRLPSGTYSSAVQAAERVAAGHNKKITVIDSWSAYMGEGLMVINGARAAEKGATHEEVVKLIEDMRHRVKILLLVDTLEYLQRGGRIGGAQALVGGLLNIKPILHVDEGRVEPLERVRTRRKAMERLVELGAEYAAGRSVQIAVGHAEAEEDARTLTELARQKMNITEEFTSDLGPVISTHTGPGVLGFVMHFMES